MLKSCVFESSNSSKESKKSLENGFIANECADNIENVCDKVELESDLTTENCIQESQSDTKNSGEVLDDSTDHILKVDCNKS